MSSAVVERKICYQNIAVWACVFNQLKTKMIFSNQKICNQIYDFLFFTGEESHWVVSICPGKDFKLLNIDVDCNAKIVQTGAVHNCNNILIIANIKCRSFSHVNQFHGLKNALFLRTNFSIITINIISRIF